MKQSDIYNKLNKIYTRLQKLDDLHEHTNKQKELVCKLERQASELEAMKY